MWTKPIQEFRQHTGLPMEYSKPNLPTVYGISEVLLPKPLDYPSNSYLTGFWFDRSPSELDEDLLDFISNGEMPILITFGSMSFENLSIGGRLHG